MQFIPNGPDIPDELIRYLEDDDLVFFCGAGVSMGEGLPSFEGLVENVYESLNRPLTESAHPFEYELFSTKQFDRCLGELERCLATDEMRSKVVNELTLPVDSDLPLHNALLKLSKNNKGQFRLVTTNFDRGFRAFAGEPLSIDMAPHLRVPKKATWRNPVYLHGAIDDSNSDGQDLVITSADFGMAYLTEGWASKFVTEILRRFNVLFVGYTVNDPVFRYLMDAVAADKKINEGEYKNQYILIEQNGSYNEAQWESRFIKPIPFNNESGDFKLFSDSILRWADRKNRQGKKAIVAEFAQNPPEAESPQNDHIVTQMKWALNDSSGMPSQLFSEIAHEDWIGFLISENLLSETQSISTTLFNPDFFPTPLPEKLWNLAKWLARHLDHQNLLDAAISSGGHIHPWLAHQIESSLYDKECSVAPHIRKFWQICLSISHDAKYKYGLRDGFMFIDALEKKVSIEEIKQVFARSFGLKINLSKPLNLYKSKEGDGTQERLNAFVDVKVGLYGNYAAKELRENIKELPYETAEGVAESCIDALEQLFKFRYFAERIEHSVDYSTIELSSVTHNDDVNNYYDTWTNLPPTLMSVVELALEKERFDWVDSILARLSSISFPLFKRLAFAITAKLIELGQGLRRASSLLESCNDSLFWSTELQPEIFHLFKAMVGAGHDGLIQDKIIQGPRRHDFNRELDDAEWQLAEDRMIFGRIGKLTEYGATICTELSTIQEQIQSRHPEWKVPTDEEGNYPFRMMKEHETAHFRIREEFDFNSSSEEEIIEFLNGASRGDNTADQWTPFAEKESSRVIKILDVIRKSGVDTISDYSAILIFRTVRENALKGNGGDCLSFWEYWVTSSEPIGIINLLAEWLKEDADRISEEVVTNVFDRLFDEAVNFVLEIDGLDAYSFATSHPVGKLVQALLFSYWRTQRKSEEGLPTWLSDRVERLLELELDGVRKVVSAILGGASMQLHYVDSSWSKARVTQLLAAEHELSIYAWEGYLNTYRTNLTHIEEILPHAKAMLRPERFSLLFSETRNRLYILFARVALDAPEMLSHTEFYEILLSAPEKARESILETCKNIMQGADNPNLFWEDQLSVYLDECWPKGHDQVTKNIAAKFVQILSSFDPPESQHFNFLKQFLTKLDSLHDYNYSVSKIAKKNPEIALEVLNLVVPETIPRYEAESLKSSLEEWQQSNPLISELESFGNIVALIESTGISF